MGTEWITVPLGEICEFRSGTAFPTKYQGWGTGDYPFIKVSDMNLPGNWRKIIQSNNWVNEKIRCKLKATVHPPGATVFAKIGIALTYNRRRLLVMPTIIDNNMMSAIPRDSMVDPNFFYYLLCTIDFNELMAGTALPYLNVSDLVNIKVTIPSLPEQRAIAHILGTLDDKIELNRRMNETLEAIARAIFKSWFVDFEPIRAKMEGRWRPGESLPGLPAHLYNLFPNRLVDSELGEIPEGWEVRELSEIADVNWGDTNTTKASYTDKGYPAYSAKGPDGFLPYYDFDRPGVIVSAIGENCGTTWLALGKWSCIKNTIRFWTTNEQVSTEFLYLATYGKEKWPVRGSAQPFISQGDARQLRILVPAHGLAAVFGEIVRPIYLKLYNNNVQSRTLVAVRDSLLPKLISGEMRVKEAEKFMGSA